MKNTLHTLSVTMIIYIFNYYCYYKTAMQIQYNITRIEEWCKSHDIPEIIVQLDHLAHATKLLQLKKVNSVYIYIYIFDIYIYTYTYCISVFF